MSWRLEPASNISVSAAFRRYEGSRTAPYISVGKVMSQLCNAGLRIHVEFGSFSLSDSGNRSQIICFLVVSIVFKIIIIADHHNRYDIQGISESEIVYIYFLILVSMSRIQFYRHFDRCLVDFQITLNYIESILITN